MPPTARGFGKPGLYGRKNGSQPMPAGKSQDSAFLPLRITFRSHVEKKCEALSFKATWFLQVIFTGISALSSLLLE